MEYLITAEFLHKNKKNENEAASKVRFQLAHLLAKQEKMFTNDELIKSSLIAAAEKNVSGENKFNC